MKNGLKKVAVIDRLNTLSVDDEIDELTDADKIKAITYHFAKIMEALGLDLEDDSLKDTPSRVAKMYVEEVFSGLDAKAFPSISLFRNTYQYSEMLVEKDIQVYSCCEHHFVPFVGKAHVAYFPADKVIGLSKLNRIVKYFSRRPQERLTMVIGNCLKEILETEDVAVIIEAKHYCVAARGVEDSNSVTFTSHLGGKFRDEKDKAAFFRIVRGQ
jgi:GTP cyclohydrolase I